MIRRFNFNEAALVDLHIIRKSVAFVGATVAILTGSVSSSAIERATKLPDGTTVDATYGYVTVPLRHGEDVERVLELSYIRVPAETPSALPPVIYLAGGPGASGTEALTDDRLGILLDDLRKTRDVLFFDQRVASKPALKLDCFFRLHLPLAPAPSNDERYRAKDLVSRQCANWLTTTGADLDAFNVVENADDIAALAKHIGAPKIALIGFSYGSQLALHVMKRYPNLVERALLGGVVGPDDSLPEPMQLDTVLNRLDRLARDPATKWPLDAPPTVAVAEALADFETPRRVSFQDKFGRHVDVDITRSDAVRVLFGDIGGTAHWSDLAEHVIALRSDDLSDIAKRISAWRQTFANSSIHASHRCKSFASNQMLSAIEAQSEQSIARDFLVFPFPEICDAWGITPFPDAHRAPVKSDTPVLIITGDLDGVTPIEDAILVASALTKAAVLEIQGMGHQGIDAYESIDPMRDAVLAFFDGKPVKSAAYRYGFSFKPEEGDGG